MKVERVDYIDEMKIRQGSRSLREWAEEIQLSASYLSDVYRGRRDPGPTLLDYLGLEKVVKPAELSYRRKTT